MNLSLGERLRKAREAKGWSQAELGKKLNVSDVTISRYETDQRNPDPETLRQLAEVLEVSVDYLIGRTDDPRTIEQINEEARQKITEALQGDEELLSFWKELSEREDLQLLFKQVRPLSSTSIRKIIKIIKAIEEEEALED